MSADYQNILAKLALSAQAAQQPPQPSFAGIAAPQDPSAQLALLAKLRQQQYNDAANATTPTPGPYGYLHDATTNGFTALGNSLGTVAGGAANAPYTPSPQALAMKQAIIGANQQYATDVANGVDPNVAKVSALQGMVKAGIPGLDESLAAATAAVDKGAETRASTIKDLSQSKMDNANIGNQADEAKNRAFNQQSGTWKTSYTDPTGYFLLQQNGNGETRRVELKPTAQAAAQLDPTVVANIAAGIKAGRIPALTGTALKTPAGMAITSLLAADPDYDGTTYPTKAKALVAFATGPEGKAVTSFNVAQTHLDTLNQAAAALNNGSLPIANKALNAVGIQAGGTAQGAFDATKNVVANEIVKTIVPGQSAVGDREEVQREITSAQTPAQLQAVIGKYQELMSGKLAGLRQQYETSTGLQNFESKLSKRSIELAHQSPSYTSQFPQTSPTGGAQPPSNTSVSLPATNAQGWTLHEDANGNRAYVSPDGRQYKQVGAQ